ncbi:hypothetical protein CMK12_02890 [Candidatus Poribacteria bacterium]|nr:hypothetical protein [Candidatus Poribacteria bacterium]MDP6594414.1 flagellar basal body-associated FliL family protein [Candidatus Poribacteria bacterium]MDP6747424.1 flagellar basal body-associated FliL family protein [Candidatus Poribacteria bacterium]MDP6996275.1 flagellar basal body-associated FliL family protein [Candidatus Poribacteria bacterium]
MRQLLIYILGLVICTAVAIFLTFNRMKQNYQETPVEKFLNSRQQGESDSKLSSEPNPTPTRKIIDFGRGVGTAAEGIRVNTADSDATRFVEVHLQLILLRNNRNAFLVDEPPTDNQKLLQEIFWAAAWDKAIEIIGEKTAFELQQEAIKLELKESLKEELNRLLGDSESVQDVIYKDFKLQ